MRNQSIKLLLVLSVSAMTALSVCQKAGAQEASWRGAAVRTNLLWDIAAAEPNLGLEIALGQNWTLGANVGFKSWRRYLLWEDDRTNPAQWRNLTLVPEFRFYPKAAYEGWFLGADLLYSHFNVGGLTFPFGVYPDVKDHRIQGDLFGGGLFAGYGWWLGSNVRLEAEAGVAGGYTQAKRFECPHCGQEQGDASGPAVVPKLGVNLVYNFTARQKAKEEVLQIIQPVVDTLVPPAPVAKPEPFTSPAPQVEEWKGVAGQLAPHHPVLRPSSEYQPYTPDRILRKEEGALYVFFEINKSQLLRSFSEDGQPRDNGPVLDEILDITRSILKDTTSSVSRIQIVGLSSVEGSGQRNQRLSDERALAMQRYIQQHLQVPDELFESVGGGEAWTELRDMVQDLIAAGGGEGLTRQQLQEVLEIMDTEQDPARREKALRGLEGGKVFQRLMEHMFKELRNSGYIRIYFDYVPDQDALTVNRAIAAIEAGRPQEALEILEAVKEDPRSRTARASALMRLGREAEAEAILKEAAGDGDTAAREYLKDWQRHQQAQEAYNRYLKELNEYNQSISTN